MAEAFHFNPFDPETRRDPYSHYARGRREFPAYRHPELPLRFPAG